MTALAAEFFTLDEVNRLKIIQDVIDRRLTTQMAAQRQNSALSLYQDSQLIHFIPDTDFEGQKKFRKGSQSEEYLTFIQNEIYASKL